MMRVGWTMLLKKHACFFAWASCLVAVVTFSMARLWTETSSWRLEDMKEKYELKSKRIQELRHQNTRQALWVKELKNNEDELLKVAREKLGLVKENELVIKIKTEGSI